MLSEFRAFIAKGNVLDLAVAVIIGAAFAKIVASLTEDIIMPVIGAMIAIALAFAIFLIETRLGSRSVRIRTDILEHEVEADESP